MSAYYEKARALAAEAENTRLKETVEGPNSRKGKFYLLSVKWSSGENITWWGPNRSGYVWNLNEAGVYTLEEAENAADIHSSEPDRTFPVPCEIADEAARHMRVVTFRFKTIAEFEARARSVFATIPPKETP